MNASSTVLKIAADGTITLIYDDAMLPLMQQGRTVTTRASHVEPAENGFWVADMAPVGGPRLGPFITRRAALVAERKYINRHSL